MHFFVSRAHNWPILFEAVTTSDSVKIDLSNFDAFVSSVYSNCKYVPLSPTAYEKAFELVLASSEQTFNYCTIFQSDLGGNFEKFKQKTDVVLKTGEEISISYFKVTGVFLKFGEDFEPYFSCSIGLPEEYLTNIKEAILPIGIVDYRANETKITFYQ